MIRRPAILSGKPIFKKVIPITRPTLFPPDEISGQISEIFATGQITNGKYVRILEKEAADYLGTRYAIALSSCTLGLILVEQALSLKGEVILPSFTFCATAHSLIWNNLKPVFVDCEGETHNINPQRVQESITPQTSAILAVDVFGNPCNREALEKIAQSRNLRLVIDAAHSFGSLYNGGKIGNYGDAQVFSLSPTKLVVAGEGGIVATNSETLVERLRLARNYGSPDNYNCEFAGLNARMTEINAIIGLKSLAMVEENVARRNKLVEYYKSRLSVIPGISFQKIEPTSRSSYKDFSILINDQEFALNRDHLAQALKAENIETRPYFYPPIHWQEAYKNFRQLYKDKLPNTEYLSTHALSLPLYSHISEEDIEKVYQAVECIHAFADEIKKIFS